MDDAIDVIDKAREAQAEGYGVWDADVVNERIVLSPDLDPLPAKAKQDDETGEITCDIGTLIDILHLAAYLHDDNDDEGDFS